MRQDLLSRSKAAWMGSSDMVLWIAVAIGVLVVAYFVWDYAQQWRLKRGYRRFVARRRGGPVLDFAGSRRQRPSDTDHFVDQPQPETAAETPSVTQRQLSPNPTARQESVASREG